MQQRQALDPRKVDLKKTTAFKCEKCEGEVFSEGLLLRRVSKFLTGEHKDGVMPLATFYCVKCGHSNEEFIPIELKPE